MKDPFPTQKAAIRLQMLYRKFKMMNFFIFCVFLVFFDDFVALKSNDYLTEDTKYSHINDFVVLELKINLLTDHRQIDTTFMLNYSQLTRWKMMLTEYMDMNELKSGDRFELESKIYQHLVEIDKFPGPLLSGLDTFTSSALSSSISSVSLLRSLLMGNDCSVKDVEKPDHLLFLTNKKRQVNSYHLPLHTFLREPHLPSRSSIRPVLPSYVMEQELHDDESPRIIIYQTRNAFTGGTTAMRILYNTVKELGFKTTLCNDTNAQSLICFNPRGKTVLSLFLVVHSNPSDFFFL
jgi:hypothetical protein